MEEMLLDSNKVALPLGWTRSMTEFGYWIGATPVRYWFSYNMFTDHGCDSHASIILITSFDHLQMHKTMTNSRPILQTPNS